MVSNIEHNVRTTHTVTAPSSQIIAKGETHHVVSNLLRNFEMSGFISLATEGNKVRVALNIGAIPKETLRIDGKEVDLLLKDGKHILHLLTGKPLTIEWKGQDGNSHKVVAELLSETKLDRELKAIVNTQGFTTMRHSTTLESAEAILKTGLSPKGKDEPSMHYVTRMLYGEGQNWEVANDRAGKETASSAVWALQHIEGLLLMNIDPTRKLDGKIANVIILLPDPKTIGVNSPFGEAYADIFFEKHHAVIGDRESKWRLNPAFIYGYVDLSKGLIIKNPAYDPLNPTLIKELKSKLETALHD